MTTWECWAAVRSSPPSGEGRGRDLTRRQRLALGRLVASGPRGLHPRMVRSRGGPIVWASGDGAPPRGALPWFKAVGALAQGSYGELEVVEVDGGGRRWVLHAGCVSAQTVHTGSSPSGNLPFTAWQDSPPRFRRGRPPRPEEPM
jgi:hypothetical protein